MNGSSWWDAVHGAAGSGWLDVGAGSAITNASVSAGMHHPHHAHHQMSNYNDYSTLTHTLAASNPHILTSGQHLLQVRDIDNISYSHYVSFFDLISKNYKYF